MTNISYFNWDKFWENIDENEHIEGIIFRGKDGHWFTIVVLPNSHDVIEITISYNPFTGEKLR